MVMSLRKFHHLVIGIGEASTSKQIACSKKYLLIAEPSVTTSSLDTNLKANVYRNTIGYYFCPLNVLYSIILTKPHFDEANHRFL